MENIGKCSIPSKIQIPYFGYSSSCEYSYGFTYWINIILTASLPLKIKHFQEFFVPKFIILHSELSLKLVLTRCVCFGRSLFRIPRENTSGYHHCMDHSKDTVEPTVMVCLSWAKHRHVLVKTIGGEDHLRPTLCNATVRSEGASEAETLAREAILLVDREAISGLRRCGLGDSDQWQLTVR